MEGELIPLSKFKLQLISLVNESRHTRDREGDIRDELDHSRKKLKQIETKYANQVEELRAELDSQSDLQKKLESRIEYLENENELLEKKEKDLKDAITQLLQSRESFIHHYEDSTCSLQRTIQMKDKELFLLSEKLNAHISLFNSVEKEANLFKRALDRVKHTLTDKEQVVAKLNEKVVKVSALEKDFVEKINSMEAKLNEYKFQIRRKDAQISELQEQLELEKISNDQKPQIEELRKTISVKDETIQRLSSEKKSMRDELSYMEVIIQRFQDVFSKLKTEDKQLLSPFCDAVNMEQNNSSKNNAEQIQIKDINMESIDNKEFTRDDKTGEDGCQQLGNESSENNVSCPALPNQN